MRGAEDTPLAAGTVIDGRYRVVAELGAGGMGRVYEAEHMFIRRAMALKLLRGGGGPEAAARMVQEATLAGQVPHPAVVRVFDCAALPDGQVYVAMELLRGETLEAALARGIDAAAALAVLAEVARGLAAVHRVGVVHRDIKPANVFLQARDSGVQAKLLDFGVAKALPGSSELAANAVRTQAGEVLGTPYYVAPEQIRGGAIDGRADLYSLGVLLYEVLTGGLPFVGESFVEILAQHTRVAPLDPRQAAPGRGIPDAAALLAMRLLAKDPAARVQDGDAVADAIAGILQGEGAALRGLACGRGVVAVAGDATVQLGAAPAATMRVAEEVPAATVRIASEGAGIAAGSGRMSEGTGEEKVSEGTGASGTRGAVVDRGGRVRTWVTGGIAAGLGVAAVVWLAGGPRVGRSGDDGAAAPPVMPTVAAPAVLETKPAPVEPRPADPGPVMPETKLAEAPVPTAPVRPASKAAKKPKDGGTTRPAIKAPAKTGDPQLKPDVYDDD